jgi:nucleotide-binding universal stress UspA family protein
VQHLRVAGGDRGCRLDAMDASAPARVLVPIAFHSPEHHGAQPGQLVDVGGAAVWIDAANLAAVRFAARLAGRGVVRLLHATPELTHVGVSGGLGAPWFPLDADGRLARVARVRATAVLRRLAELHCPEATIEIAIDAARPWRLVLADARDAHADVIVLAVSGHGPLRRALGSTADKVIRRASCPVIVVPEPPGEAVEQDSTR